MSSDKQNLLIRARDLRKAYKLYAAPHHRVLDLFGLLRPGSYREHAALDGVNLDIRRGEKVAFIGRNGAGKSTLLKLVTRVIEPTSGTLDVFGQAFALLQIGAGMHPDFTGRQNVLAYLAHLGKVGASADALLERVVDFAELEEYIDQPVKTYSTGMGARLMFSASTVVAPELLVLDEILGVGDAYFTHKSFARIQEMCSGDGTTVLLVSHDVYAASRLCDRMIWIDRGRIAMDADGPTVIRAYEDSIREQEERRLRLKKTESFKARRERRPLVVEFHAEANRPQPCPLFVGKIALRSGGNLLAAIDCSVDYGDTNAAAESTPHLDRNIGCWGDAAEWRGRSARPILHHGSPFHKAVVVLPVDVPVNLDELEVAIEYGSDQPCAFVVQVFWDGGEANFGSLPASTADWRQHVARRCSNAAPVVSIDNASGIVGTAAIHIEELRIRDADGNETHHLNHLAPMEIEIDYSIRRPDLLERADILILWHRNGVEDVCRIITRELLFDQRRQPSGTIVMRLPKLILTPAEYSISVMIAKERYFEQSGGIFYSINPDVYACLIRIFEVKVLGSGIIPTGTVCVPDAQWSLRSPHDADWTDCGNAA